MLVSVLLVGIKVTAAKELVQLIERRKEIKVNLFLLQRREEIEDKDAWIVDVAHDAQEREDRIAELGSASELTYSTSERATIQQGAGLFTAFESSSASLKQLEHSATILCSEG